MSRFSLRSDINLRAHVSEEENPFRWRAFLVCMATGFLVILNAGMASGTLPYMQNEMSISPSEYSWLASGYSLAFGLLMIPAGKLGDNFGFKTIFLFGLAIFDGASLLCSFASSASWLIVFRILQGVGAGTLAPQIIGLGQQMFSTKERGKAFGTYGALIGFSSAMGPLGGGMIVQLNGGTEWNWIFLLNFFLGIVILLLGFHLIPSRHIVGKSHRLDLIGTVLFSSGMLAFMLLLTNSSKEAFFTQWITTGIGTFSFLSFILWEIHCRKVQREPLIRISLFRQRSYAIGCSIGFLYYSGYSGASFLIPLYFQEGMGYSPLLSGAAELPLALGFSLSAAFTGRFIHRFGQKIMVAGIATVASGIIAFELTIGLYRCDTVWLVVLGPLLLIGLGSGAVTGPNQILALAGIAAHEVGSAAGVFQSLQRLGTAIGVALSGSLFFVVLLTWNEILTAINFTLIICLALVSIALTISSVDLLLPQRSKKSYSDPA